MNVRNRASHRLRATYGFHKLLERERVKNPTIFSLTVAICCQIVLLRKTFAGSRLLQGHGLPTASNGYPQLPLLRRLWQLGAVVVSGQRETVLSRYIRRRLCRRPGAAGGVVSR